MKRVVVLAVVALCACAQLTGVDDLSIGEKPRRGRTASEDASTELDAASDPDAPENPPDGDTNPTIDSGTDTTPPGCTALPTNDTFPAAVAAPWLLLGTASAAMPGARLTPNLNDQFGALYWNSKITFDRFDVSFAYVITTDAASTLGPGDGMTFAWINSPNVPTIFTGAGGGLTVLGLTGWAVAIDTYQNNEYMDPAVPNISVKDTTTMTNIASTASNATLIDGKPHVVRVRLVNGTVTVSLDGTEAIGATTLPGYTAFAGYWGFGAGTGMAFEDHKLTSVTARIGTTGPCASP